MAASPKLCIKIPLEEDNNISWQIAYGYTKDYMLKCMCLSSFWTSLVCTYIDMIYPGIVTRRFWKFVPELWPLVYAKILLLLNILRINWQNFTKFYLCIHIDKI